MFRAFGCNEFWPGYERTEARVSNRLLASNLPFEPYPFAGVLSIELPPLPVSFDFELWMDNYELFAACAEDYIPVRPISERLNTLFEQEEGLMCLSPAGELFHQHFYVNYTQQRHVLLPEAAEKKLGISYEDKNSGKHRGLEDYLNRILEVPYVKKIYTHYYNPDLPSRNSFRRSTKEPISQVEGTYSDGKATTVFDVVTTATTEAHLRAIMIDLYSRFVEGA